MPVVAPVTVTAEAVVATGLLTVIEASRRVARVVGGGNNVEVLDEAEDAILAALEELNVAWDWDFLRQTTTITLVDGTADYNLPTNHRSIYDVRLTSNAIPLRPFRQRDYDRITSQPTSGTPIGYNVFPSSAVEALDPQHTGMSIRFIPTPSMSDTATVKYYRRTSVLTSTGYTIDLPRQYQFWVVYAAKAMILADRGGDWDRATFWQKKADRLLQLMKFDDQSRLTDNEGDGFKPGDFGILDLSHPQTALWAIDGF